MLGYPSNSNNIISYYGPISLDLSSFLGKYIKTIISADKPVVTRVYKIFMELVQNVSNYSVLNNEKLQHKNAKRNGIGWLSVDELEDAFSISTGNLIFKEHGPILQKNCDQINSLNLKELRQLKRETRKLAGIKDIGAHIGLIHTGLITNNPLIVEITTVDETHSFYKITVQVDKTINN